MTEDGFYTTEDVLGYLHVNLRTVYRMVRKEELPAIRVGRQWRFRKKDLDAWLRKAQARKAGAAQRRRVLIVDDDDSARKLLTDAFEMGAYDVETAEDGLTAVERLRDASYDLLVTDLQMPGMGGLAVIREARRMASPAELPIVIITGRSTEASAIEAINLGVSGYLLKPFRPFVILATAARALGDPEPSVEAQG